jgi:hypothetical protein
MGQSKEPEHRRGLWAPLLALLSPILSGMSRLRSTVLCLAPGRVDGAAAPRWAPGRSRGEGEPLAGGGAAPVGGARGGRAQKCCLNFLSARSSPESVIFKYYNTLDRLVKLAASYVPYRNH